MRSNFLAVVMCGFGMCISISAFSFDFLAIEQGAPTASVSFRLNPNGTPEPAFSSVGWMQLVGQKVRINARKANGVDATIDQVVITTDLLDQDSQSAILTVRDTSSGAYQFTESAVWLAYTASGRSYLSQPITSNSSESVDAGFLNEELFRLLQRIRSREGSSFLISDLELYHTHPEAGEPLSSGDQDQLNGLWRLVTRESWFGSGSTVAIYAIPMKGQIIFRKSYRQR